jgi:hypothetical protein
VVPRFVFIQACQRYQRPNDGRCIIPAGDGVGVVQQVSTIFTGFCSLSAASDWPSSRMIVFNLAPSILLFASFHSNRRGRLLAYVSVKESRRKPPFPPSSVPFSHELRVSAIERSDTFCQMLGPPQHEPLFLNWARTRRISAQHSRLG